MVLLLNFPHGLLGIETCPFRTVETSEIQPNWSTEVVPNNSLPPLGEKKCLVWATGVTSAQTEWQLANSLVWHQNRLSLQTFFFFCNSAFYDLTPTISKNQWHLFKWIQMFSNVHVWRNNMATSLLSFFVLSKSRTWFKMVCRLSLLSKYSKLRTCFACSKFLSSATKLPFQW